MAEASSDDRFLGIETIMRLTFQLFSAALGIALFAWVLRDVDVARLADTFIEADLWLWSLLLPLVAVNLLIRAWRWWMILGDYKHVRISLLYQAIAIGYLSNNILPARAGDLVRVYFLGKRANISKSHVLATVALERIIDLVCACLLLGAVSLLVDLPDWLRNAGMMIGLGAAGVLAMLFALETVGDRLVRLVLALFAWAPKAILVRLQILMEGFLDGFQGLRNWRAATGFITLTVLLWSNEILIIWISAKVFNLDISFGQTLVLMLFGVFASMVPALPGQLGAFEFAVVSGAGFLGITGDAVFAFAVGWHMSLLILTSSIGAISLAVSGQSFMRINRKATTEKVGATEGSL